jgi:hypothetical protein
MDQDDDAAAKVTRHVVRAVRYTPAEWDQVKEAAAAVAMPPSTFVHHAALGVRIQARRGVKADEAIRELARIGNNLNQLTRQANQSGRMPDAEHLAAVLEIIVEKVRDL